jgi:hypothetical protein
MDLFYSKKMFLYNLLFLCFYEFYNSRYELDKYINDNNNLFQCIISKDDIDFGQSQFPKLDDYADNIDTLEFLSKL